MPAGGGALLWLRNSLSRGAFSIFVIIACKTLVFRPSHAFRPSTVLFENSVLLEPRAPCDVPTVEISGDGRDSSAVVQLEQRDNSGLLDDAGDTREGFLRSVVGVGLGFAAGSVCEAEPANALFEDAKKPGKCPPYQAVPDFDVDKYMGIWYELAYHDWTQISLCGCTRFNMTRIDTRIKDAFTAKCPYAEDVGETFLINMREVVDFATPGSFQEYAFYNKWDNKVVALWKSTGAGGVEAYERAIQMQCVEILGRRAFVGINFLSRTPIVAPGVLADMFDRARALGLAEIGGNPAEMEIVRHGGCRYPSSTENLESRSWGSAWGVNTLVL